MCDAQLGRAGWSSVPWMDVIGVGREPVRRRPQVMGTIGWWASSRRSTCTASTVWFFFSSRRRHTRCSRDWSSDVCSSDLYFAIAADDDKREPEVKNKLREAFAAAKVRAEIEVYPNALHGWCVPDSRAAENKQIGRASCRERV